MIGQFTVEHQRRNVLCTLENDLTWTCSDPDVLEYLKTVHPASKIHPADGLPGVRLVTEAAAGLEGKITYLAEQKADAKPGVRW
jgi:hypothetical protein